MARQDPRLKRREGSDEMLPPNEWWDELAEEVQEEVMLLALVSVKAEGVTPFWEALPVEEKLHLMTRARDAAVANRNEESARARRAMAGLEAMIREEYPSDLSLYEIVRTWGSGGIVGDEEMAAIRHFFASDADLEKEELEA